MKIRPGLNAGPFLFRVKYIDLYEELYQFFNLNSSRKEKIMKARDDGYTLLGEAIIEQAADDYLRARKTLYKIENGLYSNLSKERLNERANRVNRELKDCMDFFNGKWYQLLTKLDSSVLVEKLDETFEEWKTSKEFKDWKRRYDKLHKKQTKEEAS